MRHLCLIAAERQQQQKFRLRTDISYRIQYRSVDPNDINTYVLYFLFRLKVKIVPVVEPSEFNTFFSSYCCAFYFLLYETVPNPRAIDWIHPQ